MPTPEQTNELIASQDSSHLTVCVGYHLGEDDTVYRESVGGGEQFVTGLEMIKERGAVRGKDYILVCYWNQTNRVFVSLHTKNCFLSQEDIIE